jgi:two-component system, chemotaxis family, protein-glutamate methylesterase/glutaminase
LGASAGGVNATAEVISRIKTGIDAAIFVVIHLSGKGITELVLYRMQKHTEYKCKIARHGEEIETDTLYLAPAGLHLLLRKDEVLLGQGPAESRWRPSIDILFRAAAAAYGVKVIGIILSGLLDDGTAGMLAIKRSGGSCIVQDPNEAEFPEMPISVLNMMEVDYCVPLAAMGDAIDEVLGNLPNKSTVNIPADVIAEAEIAERTFTSVSAVKDLGQHSVYSCPDCGGGLWELKNDGLKRFRCHIGHMYSQDELFSKQGENLEATLWVALRMMEERKSLIDRMATEERRRGLKNIAVGKEERSENLLIHIQKLKEVLFAQQKIKDLSEAETR